MPREFGSHPVTWAVRDHLGLATELEKELLSMLPATIVTALHGKVRLFLADWIAICEYAVRCPIILQTKTDIA